MRQLTDIEMIGGARMRGLGAAIDPDEPTTLGQVLALLAELAGGDAIAAAINDLVDGAPAAMDTLRELADALVDEQDAVAALTGLVASKATQADLAALAAIVAGISVPLKASGADLRGLADDARYLTAKAMKDAITPAALLDVASPDLALPVQYISLAANSTLGAPVHVTPGTSGCIFIKQPAAGGPYLLVYNAAWRPFGSTPALSTTAGAVDLLVWIVDELGVVSYFLCKGRAS